MEMFLSILFIILVISFLMGFYLYIVNLRKGKIKKVVDLKKIAKKEVL